METVEFPKEITRELLDKLAYEIICAIGPLGYTLDDFGGRNYLAPVPGTLNGGKDTPVMFILKTVDPTVNGYEQ